MNDVVTIRSERRLVVVAERREVGEHEVRPRGLGSHAEASIGENAVQAEAAQEIEPFDTINL